MSNITNKNKKILAITGYPCVGKSTLALKIAEEIKNFGCLIGGFITPEKRINNIRVGFSIIDLISKPILTTFYIKLKQIKPEIFSILSLGEVIQIGFENRYSLSKKANEFARWLIDGSCSSKGR